MADVRGGVRRSAKPPDQRVETGELVQRIEEHPAEHPAPVVLEDGRVLFEMRTAHFSVAESQGRFLLQLWSEELNLAHTVVAVQARDECLLVMTAWARPNRRCRRWRPRPTAARDGTRPGR